MLKTSLLLQKVRVGSNSVITCNRVTVLALCTISDGHFSMYRFILILFYTFRDFFVCVEVLRPSQPNGVMSSAVSLPNHTFTGQA